MLLKSSRLVTYGQTDPSGNKKKVHRAQHLFHKPKHSTRLPRKAHLLSRCNPQVSRTVAPTPYRRQRHFYYDTPLVPPGRLDSTLRPLFPILLARENLGRLDHVSFLDVRQQLGILDCVAELRVPTIQKVFAYQQKAHIPAE